MMYLKWAGGKTKLASRIADALGAHEGGTRYWEPFVGSAAVAFYLSEHGLVPPREMSLSDISKPLVNLHRRVCEAPDQVHAVLATFPWQDGEWQPKFAAMRDRLNSALQAGDMSFRTAALFIWMNRAGFNGLWRVNSKGLCNVPPGSYRDLAHPTLQDLTDVAALLRGAWIAQEHFSGALSNAQEGDQVYADPPYVPLSATASFTSYDGGGFSSDDQRQLARELSRCADRGARVVASNHDTPFVRDTYGALGFSFLEVDGARVISCKGGSRKPAKELLITKGPVR